ncbi:putative oxidoreductase, aryl-alcohol dehydrogenase like protein [Bernardetia litoralis DSM 6794]|uniref:Putative oxidoreductase, aryl-alcohol dehydrogenase like protein n=1 Tax=Bernardetia litoralis (strain ATCC 23117 / DSM 6794 / NBRC 15988 / NCIMB 1366 / Fx l1 / Sio-4) TaxID=880071 RepID=I4API7_BERLS|nr:aldo/keto reductase [Bernardetia litoralis]AFM05872.1 putative oxidoreductase, aryl-alcohol dehydrogenase like protein [Bernardetia litoralis DSM 6794]
MNYKLFGKSGLRVSELCLGTMTFGEEWGNGADKETSKKMFETFANAGGNFLDTANRYTEGTSEKYVGEFIHSDRDYFVLATKYTLYDNKKDPNAAGNHRKNMMRSVEASLKRLNTDYIDLLWVHMWDGTTQEEEMMRGLDDLISSGKVHYIGISDTPAWVVSKANTLAHFRGWSEFVGLQVEWSLIERTVERDLIPMAKDFELAITPWSPLGSGILTGKYNDKMIEGSRLSSESVKYNEHNLNIAKKVVEVAQNLGVSAAQVALAWLKAKDSKVIPIIGSRKVRQLEDSLGCLNVELSADSLEQLDKVSEIDLGFPHKFLKSDNAQNLVFGDNKDKIIH